MHHDEWRLVTFGDRMMAILRVIAMSARQLLPLIIMVFSCSTVAILLSGMIETYVNDGSSDWSFVSTLLTILVIIAFGVFSFWICLTIAIIAYRTIMYDCVPTWREALCEGFDRLDAVVWESLIYLLPFVAYAVVLFDALMIIDTGANGFGATSLIMSVIFIAILIGLVVADAYVGFYWLAMIGENKRGVDALRSSYQLVRSRWRWVLLNKIAIGVVLCLIFLLGIGIALIVSLLFYTSLLDSSAFDIGTWVSIGLFNLTFVITGSAYMAFLIVLYKSLQCMDEQHIAPISTP